MLYLPRNIIDFFFFAKIPDDYYKALNHARRAEETSNMESADEGPQKRKKKTVRQISK